MTNNLTVYYHGESIGTLNINKGRRYTFSYTEEWLQNEDAIPISISLPLSPGEFDEDKSMSFFSNLLPESTIRKELAKQFRLSEKDSYGLLEIIGGECAGAINILPNEIEFTKDGEYEEIPSTQLNELLDTISKNPLLAGTEGIRLSLAGAQDKLPVYYEGGKFFLPKGNYASTHIIKTPLSDEYPYSVINEAFCMSLAKELGLPVPKVIVIRNAHKHFYLIERYDRFPDEEGNIIRLHQEDFCQALGVSPEEKYEENGGPSLLNCFNLINEYSINPAVDKQYLLKWVMFNLLIGNADSHAKNLSFLYNEGEISLSPFYDLLCTKIYPGLNKKFSMKIGRRRDTHYLSIHDWKYFSEIIGIKFSIFPELCHELMEDLDSKISKTKKIICNTKKEERFVEGVEKIIQKRKQLLLAIK